MSDTPKLTLLHNPHCSTSVHALEAAGRDVAVRKYLLQRPILDDGTHAMIGRPRSRAAEWAASGRVA